MSSYEIRLLPVYKAGLGWEPAGEYPEQSFSIREKQTWVTGEVKTKPRESKRKRRSILQRKNDR